MSTYTLGGVTYRRQSDVKKRRTDLAVIGTTYTEGPDFEFLADLYCMDPGLKDVEIASIMFVSHPGHGGNQAGALVLDTAGIHHPYPSYHYGLRITDEDIDSGCAAAKADEIRTQKRKAKMRLMVRARLNGPCVMCGKPASDMDHEPPDTFDVLAREWLAKNPDARLEYDDDDVDHARPRFVGEHNRSWREFHDRRAKLRPVCKPCHKIITYGDSK